MTYKLDGSEIIYLKSQIRQHAKEKKLANQEEQIKQYVFDTIGAIIGDVKFGSEFIPEIDGQQIIKQTLPIQEAIIQGKESDEYKSVAIAYSIVKHYMQAKVDEMSKLISDHYAYKSSKKPTLDELDVFS